MTFVIHQPSYLLQWDHACAADLDRDIVLAKHRLAELSLASDQRLADMLERCATDRIAVFTMGDNPAYPNQWQPQSFNAASGATMLEQIRNGRLYVVLRGVADIEQAYDSVSERLYEELAECNSAFCSSAHATDLVLASPGAMQYFDVDHKPGIRYQLRGIQTVVTYPSSESFVDDSALENTVLDGASFGRYYEPDFEKSARRTTIRSGQLLSIPHPTPSRSEFSGDLCVWIQTRHHTPQSLKRRNVAAFNRAFGRFLPATFTRPQQTGFVAAIKSLIGTAFSLPERVSVPGADQARCCCSSANVPQGIVRQETKRTGDDMAAKQSPASFSRGLSTQLPEDKSPNTGALLAPNPLTHTTVVSEN
jgi:hypothetical protein